jgi:hypothetical protein
MTYQIKHPMVLAKQLDPSFIQNIIKGYCSCIDVVLNPVAS